MAVRGRSKRPSRTGLARVGGDVRLSVGWLRHRRCRQGGSGIARSRARARLNWVSQGQCLGRCKVRRLARAGEPSRQGEEPPPEGLGGHDLLAQSDSRRPAGQVVGHRLYRQPGGVGGEAARGEMVQPDAVLEVAYRILDLGVAAMVSLQIEHLPVPVGDEAVIAIAGEEGQLGTRRGLHPPEVIWIRSGWLRGSIYWVLLFRGRFLVAKPLSQIQRSTFLPLQDANPTPSFGGFGLSKGHLC